MNKYQTETSYIARYYNSLIFEFNHSFTLKEEKRATLNPDAYRLLGYSMEQIENMTDQDLNSVNEQVYKFFQVDKQATNSEELLMKAVNYFKRYGNRVTTGNGYVDFLLFASIIATAIFIVVLVLFR